MPRTTGRLIHAIVRTPLPYLIGLYVLYVFCISMAISNLYMPEHLKPYESNLFERFLYVFSMHYAIGYGDVSPINAGRAVYVAHIVASQLANALFMGCIVVKLFWTNKALVVSDAIIYHPDQECFRIQLYNSHKLNIVDLSCKMFLAQRKKSSTHPNSHTINTYVVAMKKPSYAWAKTHQNISITTSRAPHEQEDQKLFLGKENVITPAHITKTSSFRVILSGIFEEMGGQTYIQTKRYRNRDIYCGIFEKVKKTNEKGKVTSCDWALFGKVRVSSDDQCAACKYLDGCVMRKNNLSYSASA